MKITTTTIIYLRGIFILIAFFAIFYTNPQIELLLDSAYHVSGVMHLIKQGVADAYSPAWHIERHLWHSCWAIILKPFMPLATTSVFKIIYTVQLLLTFILVYLSAYLLLRTIAKNISSLLLEISSFFSAFLYLFTTCFFSFSWASMFAVSYMITMPLAVYLCAFCLDRFYQHKFTKVDGVIFILVSAFILAFHAAEYAYVIILCVFLFVFNLQRVSLKLIISLIVTFSMVILLLYFTPILGAKFTTLASYHQIYQNDPSNHVIPLTEWVYLAGIVAIMLIIVRIITARVPLHLNSLLLVTCYSVFMAYFAISIQSRELFFIQPPYLTARFIYGSFWFIFIPLGLSLLLGKLPQYIGSALYLFLSSILVVSLYDYSKAHDAGFSLIAKRLMLSHDGDYISRVTYANFAKVDDYLKSYNCSNVIFSGNDDISAAIGIAGCNSDTNYYTFGRLSPEQLQQLSAKYQLIKVPELFTQGDNQKYGQMWSIR
jgi:hypothetical protein